MEVQLEEPKGTEQWVSMQELNAPFSILMTVSEWNEIPFSSQAHPRQHQYAKGKMTNTEIGKNNRLLHTPAGSNAHNPRCLVERIRVRLAYAKDYTYIGSHNAALGSDKDQTDEDGWS